MEAKKISFFNRVKIAITKFEGYSDFAVEKLSVAIKYYLKIVLILSIILSIAFTYKFSKIINSDDEVQIIMNQLSDTGIDTEQFKQGIETIRSGNSASIYAILGSTLTLYLFLVYSIYGLFDILVVSAVGVVVTWITRIRMKYKPIFIMSIYALTLPIILNIIYLTLNILTGFTISYFQIVYNIIAYIYIVTVILIIKSDLIDQQKELIKIVEEQKIVKREQEESQPDEEEKKDKKDKEPEDDPIQNQDPNSEPEG